MKLINSIILILLGIVFGGFILNSAYGAVPTPIPAPQEGPIRGRVYDAATGRGLSSVTLRAYDLDGNPADKGGARTGSGGNYELPELRTGLYRLKADPNSIPGGSNYGVQYYNQKTTRETADWIPTNSSGIDFPLITASQGWEIAGRVYDRNTGTGLSGIRVSATGELGAAITTTDSQGNYSLTGLSADTYYLRAQPGFMSDQPVYIPQYYDQKDTVETADMVAQPSTGIDFPLKKGGIITGRILDEETGVGLPDITVNAYDRNYAIVSFIRTDADGYYSLRPFPTGDFRLWATTDYFNYQHSPECYSSRWYVRGTAFCLASDVSAMEEQTTIVGDWFLAPCGPTPTPVPTPFEKIILISQLSTGGPDDAYSDNFVEIYNASKEDVPLAGWSLHYKDKYTEDETLVHFSVATAPNMVRAESYFLFAREYYYQGAANYTWVDTDLYSNRGAVWLIDGSGQEVDRLGWGESEVPLGSAAPVQRTDTGSIMRKVSARSTAASISPGGVEYGFGRAYNTNDNGNDFLSIPVRDPQNSWSGPQPPFPDLPPLNPSFEESPDLVDWTIEGPADKITKSSEEASDGSYSCRFQDLTVDYSDRGIRSNIGGAAAGSSYDFSGCFFVKDAGYLQPITDTKMLFMIEWLDSDKNIISVPYAYDSNPAFDTWYRWVLVPPMEAPPGTMYVRLYLACEDSGYYKKNDVFIDDFYVTRHVETPEIVISQLAPKGPNGYSDTFVEIYNYGSGSANLSGCTLNYMKADGSEPQVVVNIPNGTTMPPHTYFLFGEQYWYNDCATVKADLTWDDDNVSFWSHGGNVWMANIAEERIDLVGWGDSQFAEGDNPIPEQPVDDCSFKRKVSSWSTEASISPGGSEYRFGNAYDTQNNGNDFLTVSPRDPRNSSHSAVSPFPTPPVTPTPGEIEPDNNSFEEDPDLVNWNKVGTAAEILRSDTYAYDGTYSCKFSAPTTDYADHGVRSDTAPANPGSTYDFSGYFYVPFAGGGSESDSKLQYLIEWRDSGAGIISTDGSSDWSVSLFNAWEEKKYEGVIAPAGAAGVTIYLAGKNNPASTSDIYIDYFSILETAAAASPTPTAYLITPTPTSYISTPTPIPLPTPSAHTMPHLYLADGDYDGDSHSDIAVFRPASGLWAIRYLTRCYFGADGDLAVSGDYDGDGSSDIAIYRPDQGLWAILNQSRFYFGREGDLPVPRDYRGSGICLPAVFRPAAGSWRIRDLSTVYFGQSGDFPLPADYRGSGTGSIAIYRPPAGMWAIKDLSRIYFGGAEDLPRPGDYNGDGSGDIAVFRADSGLWAIAGITRSYYGREGDFPVPADFNGDGLDQISVFRSATGAWWINDPDKSGVDAIYFGSGEDQPATR